MTSIIKTQLASYLEKFVKNFEREQLRLSITKGRFELNDLEFDEDVLTDLMELPTWLRVDKITCNRLYVKIAWRKIQTQPLHVHLDEVRVILATCPELRTPRPPISLGSLASLPMPSMKYRLPHKVIDGTYLTINSVHIDFKTTLMQAHIQLLQLRSFASTPEWQQADVIPKGRVKNSDLDETLIFRQVEFESMKVELASIGQNINESQPIRLITSAGNFRMIMKRRLSDASVICVKLGKHINLGKMTMPELILPSDLNNMLEQIQLGLSETEMKSTVDFVRDIMHLSKASAVQTRVRKAQSKYVVQEKGKEALQDFLKKHIGEEYSEQMDQRPHFKDPKARYYMRHNIYETSHHMLIKAVDLTIVHDNNMPESFPEYRQQARYADASMAFRIENIRMDMYPFHLEQGGYYNWMTRHHQVPGSADWIGALLSGYKRELGALHSSAFDEDVKALMSTTVIASIGSMFIYPVVTAHDLKRGNKPQELPFMSFTKEQFGIPDSVPAIEVSRTQYYYAKDVQWPVPKVNMFVSMSPMKIALDPNTVDWMTLMAMHVGLDLIQKMKELEKFMIGSNEPSSMKTLMRVEAYFPQIFFPKSFINRRERSAGVLIQAASMVITNTSIGQTKMVSQGLPDMLKTNLFAHPTFFPNMSSDWSLPSLINHFMAYSEDPARRPSLMAIEVNDLWAGAVSDELSPTLPLPFLDAFSLRMWLAPGSADIAKTSHLIWGAAVVEMDTPTIRVQLNEYTLKLLAAVSDGLQKLGEVGAEHMQLLKKLGAPSLGLCLLMQQENVEMSFVLQKVDVGPQISADVALAVSNLNIAKDTASERASVTSLSGSLAGTPSQSINNIHLMDNISLKQQQQPSPLANSTSKPIVAEPNLERYWWRRNRYYKSGEDSEPETDEPESGVEEESGVGDTSSEAGYVSDEEEEETYSIAPSDVDDLDLTSNGQFTWSGVGADKRRVPLAEVPAKLLCLTLKSLQAYLMISHGHTLVKMRLGRIESAETKDVALAQVSSVPLQEPDLDVNLPEYMDSLLVRFENGEHSGRGSPAILSVLRGLNLSISAEAVRRLMSVVSGVSGGDVSEQGAPVPSDPLAAGVPKEILKWTSVPLIDIRVMNTQVKLKDAIESIGANVDTSRVRDLTLKISGFAVKSQDNGIITVGSLREEEFDEEENIDHPDPRMVKRQLAVLSERKARMESRISQLQSRTDGPL